MKNLTLFVALLTLNACGQAPGDYETQGLPSGTQSSNSQPQLNNYASYVNAYLAEGAVRDNNISLNGLQVASGDVSDPKSIIAVCYDFGTPGVGNKIIVNLAIWNTLTEISRQYTIFHELGHCLLHRSHTASHSSMMYPNILDDATYTRGRSAFLDEMFIIADRVN